MLWFVIVCFASAASLSAALTILMRRIAPRLGWVDQPAARKVHDVPTPLGGGVAIFLGFVLPILAALLIVWMMQQNLLPVGWIPAELRVHLDGVTYRGFQLGALLVAGLILVVMGLLDDRFGLSWKLRLLVQFLVAGGLVASGVQATLFVSQPWIGQLASLLWIVVLINSLNFLDNMDGLSSGIALIAALLFASIMLGSVGEPRWLVAGCLLVLAGAVAGFLIFNWPPASIFMGDAGSTVLGMLLASLTILGTFYDESLPEKHVMLAPLCILAVPLYDFTSVILIRIRAGHSPFHPDKNHFSHRLTALGLTKPQAVLTVHLATLTTGLGGLLLYRVHDWVGAGLVVALILCLLRIISILEMTSRKQQS